MEPELHLGLILLSNRQDTPAAQPALQAMANELLAALDTRTIRLP